MKDRVDKNPISQPVVCRAPKDNTTQSHVFFIYQAKETHTHASRENHEPHRHTLPAEHHHKPVSQPDYTHLMEGVGGTTATPAWGGCRGLEESVRLGGKAGCLVPGTVPIHHPYLRSLCTEPFSPVYKEKPLGLQRGRQTITRSGERMGEGKGGWNKEHGKTLPCCSFLTEMRANPMQS